MNQLDDIEQISLHNPIIVSATTSKNTTLRFDRKQPETEGFIVLVTPEVGSFEQKKAEQDILDHVRTAD